MVIRVDYNISDNTKLFVRYNLQRETQQFPVGLWWRQTDQVPYPTPVLARTGLIRYRVVNSCIQPDNDERNRIRLHVRWLPERLSGSGKVEPKTVGFNNPAFSRMGFPDSFVWR